MGKPDQDEVNRNGTTTKKLPSLYNECHSIYSVLDVAIESCNICLYSVNKI